nr:uncharacterized protein LOC129283529 [Lytechinus pictus]
MELVSREDIGSAEDAFQVLRSVFGEVGSQASQKRKFFSRLQKRGETLIEYSHELIRLLQTWRGVGKQDREETLISQFIEGVSDADLRRELLRRSQENPAPFVALRDWAVQWERQGSNSRRSDRGQQWVESQEQGVSSTDNQSISLVLEALQQQNKLVSALLTQQEEQSRVLNSLLAQSRPRWPQGCFQCGAKDHIRRNCPRTRNLNE